MNRRSLLVGSILAGIASALPRFFPGGLPKDPRDGMSDLDWLLRKGYRVVEVTDQSGGGIGGGPPKREVHYLVFKDLELRQFNQLDLCHWDFEFFIPNR